ncbi:MAG: CARDB domain-containing protein [Myxococcales bacterium]
MRAWLLVLAFGSLTWSGCSGGGTSAGHGDGDDQDGGPIEDDSGSGGDLDDGSTRTCEEQGCAAGQVCDPQGSGCVGSCEGITCPAQMECRVENNMGSCVASCEPGCAQGQRCERDVQGVSSCVDNSCADAHCSELEVCVPAADGHGNVCQDNRCDADVQCAADQYCNGTICVGDLCAPGAGRCEQGAVLECQPNGAAEFTRVTCVTEPGLESLCPEGGTTCTCRDDWDCPAYTECKQGSCEGTGKKAACTIQPQAFADLLPVKKPGFPWGGDDLDGYTDKATPAPGTSRNAKNSASGKVRPFKEHAQVSAVPVVANLDDDNGDGKINELDSPEVVFPAFCSGAQTNYQYGGMLRAVHGGGSRLVPDENDASIVHKVSLAGEDYFAVCAGKTWKEGDPTPSGAGDCACGTGDLEPNGGVAVGDIDHDGFPEIVYMGHAASQGENNRLVIYRNDGQLITQYTMPKNFKGPDPAAALANIDHVGFAEIVVGSTVIFLKQGAAGLEVDHVLYPPAGGMQGINGDGGSGAKQGAMSCITDLVQGGSMELVSGSSLYFVPGPADCEADATGDLCVAYNKNELLPHTTWNAAHTAAEGFCAIADVFGPIDAAHETANPPTEATNAYADLSEGHGLDGQPEVVLVSSGYLRVYDGATGRLRFQRTLRDKDGGAPNIDDFDGDGFPEVGTAFDNSYFMVDFQPPTAMCPRWDTVLDGDPNSADPTSYKNGAGNQPRATSNVQCSVDADCGSSELACNTRSHECVCLHNGWSSTTQDTTSRVTGSSVFDFNGDGAAEVVYNDECYFRIYEGKTGKVYQRLDSQSPTRIEYPVVADVDGDGNAEIVYSGSNLRSESCGPIRPALPTAPPDGTRLFINGINVIGDPTDGWISARRIWNQHAYHITNVHEDGSIPADEVPNWRSYGGRNYNTYRSNLPPIDNIAPDLVVAGLTVNAPSAACGGLVGTEIKIVALIKNQGDLGTGPDVKVRFTDEADNELGVQTLGVALAPGAETFVTLVHDAGALPSKVKALVDYTATPIDGLVGSVRECQDFNNTAEADVVVTTAIPELRVAITGPGSSCPSRSMQVTVFNDSQVAVPEVKVTLYAGNPVVGGAALRDVTFSNLAGESQQTQTVSVDVGDLDVNVHAVVDPERKIAECDDTNNTNAFTVECSFRID